MFLLVSKKTKPKTIRRLEEKTIGSYHYEVQLTNVFLIKGSFDPFISPQNTFITLMYNHKHNRR